MPNKTIYVKDEATWEEAKKQAGKEGLSGVIEAALQEYVERKKTEKLGFEARRFLVYSDLEPEGRFVRFNGRLLTEVLVGGDVGRERVAQVFLTKGGKIVAILHDAISGEATDFFVYESPEAFTDDKSFLPDVPPEARASGSVPLNG